MRTHALSVVLEISISTQQLLHLQLQYKDDFAFISKKLLSVSKKTLLTFHGHLMPKPSDSTKKPSHKTKMKDIKNFLRDSYNSK